MPIHEYGNLIGPFIFFNDTYRALIGYRPFKRARLLARHPGPLRDLLINERLSLVASMLLLTDTALGYQLVTSTIDTCRKHCTPGPRSASWNQGFGCLSDWAVILQKNCTNTF